MRFLNTIAWALALTPAAFAGDECHEGTLGRMQPMCDMYSVQKYCNRHNYRKHKRQEALPFDLSQEEFQEASDLTGLDLADLFSTREAKRSRIVGRSAHLPRGNVSPYKRKYWEDNVCKCYRKKHPKTTVRPTTTQAPSTTTRPPSTTTQPPSTTTQPPSTTTTPTTSSTSTTGGPIQSSTTGGPVQSSTTPIQSTTNSGQPGSSTSAGPGSSTVATSDTSVVPPGSTTTVDVPTTTAETTINVPTTTQDTTVDVPTTTPETTINVPTTTQDTTVDVPTTTPETTINVPTTTQDTTVDVPTTTPETTINVPTTTLDTTIDVPTTTLDTTINVPTTTGDTTIDVPTTTGDTTIDVPTTTGDTTVDVPTTSFTTTDLPATSTTSGETTTTTGPSLLACPSTPDDICTNNGASGSTTCLSGTTVLVVDCGLQYQGTSINPPPDRRRARRGLRMRQQTGFTLGECESQCAENAQCVAGNYLNGVCTLFGSISCVGGPGTTPGGVGFRKATTPVPQTCDTATTTPAGETTTTDDTTSTTAADETTTTDAATTTADETTTTDAATTTADETTTTDAASTTTAADETTTTDAATTTADETTTTDAATTTADETTTTDAATTTVDETTTTDAATTTADETTTTDAATTTVDETTTTDAATTTVDGTTTTDAATTTADETNTTDAASTTTTADETTTTDAASTTTTADETTTTDVATTTADETTTTTAADETTTTDAAATTTTAVDTTTTDAATSTTTADETTTTTADDTTTTTAAATTTTADETTTTTADSTTTTSPVPTDSCEGLNGVSSTYTTNDKDFTLQCSQAYIGSDRPNPPYFQNDIERTGAPQSFQACLDRCGSNAECIAMSFQPGLCVLWRNVNYGIRGDSTFDSAVIPNPAVTDCANGPYTFDDTGKTFNRRCGLAYQSIQPGDQQAVDSNARISNVPNYKACLDICSSYSSTSTSCIAISYAPVSKACVLFSSIAAGEYTSTEYDSGLLSTVTEPLTCAALNDPYIATTDGPNGATFTKRCGTAYTVAPDRSNVFDDTVDLNKRDVAQNSFRGCVDQCGATSGCVASTYDGTTCTRFRNLDYGSTSSSTADSARLLSTTTNTACSDQTDPFTRGGISYKRQCSFAYQADNSNTIRRPQGLPDYASCVDACSRDNTCVASIFVRSSGECVLLNGITLGGYNSDAYDSATRSSARDTTTACSAVTSPYQAGSKQFDTQCNQVYFGPNNVANRIRDYSPAGGYQNCMNTCGATSNCIAISYQRGNELCILWNDISPGSGSNNDFDSALITGYTAPPQTCDQLAATNMQYYSVGRSREVDYNPICGQSLVEVPATDSTSSNVIGTDTSIPNLKVCLDQCTGTTDCVAGKFTAAGSSAGQRCTLFNNVDNGFVPDSEASFGRAASYQATNPQACDASQPIEKRDKSFNPRCGQGWTKAGGSSVISTLSGVADLARCIDDCSLDATCVAVNFYAAGTCELLNAINSGSFVLSDVSSASLTSCSAIPAEALVNGNFDSGTETRPADSVPGWSHIEDSPATSDFRFSNSPDGTTTTVWHTEFGGFNSRLLQESVTVDPARVYTYSFSYQLVTNSIPSDTTCFLNPQINGNDIASNQGQVTFTSAADTDDPYATIQVNFQPSTTTISVGLRAWCSGFGPDATNNPILAVVQVDDLSFLRQGADQYDCSAD